MSLIVFEKIISVISKNILLIMLFKILFFTSNIAYSIPSGGVTLAGDAIIQMNEHQVSVTQHSDRAVIDWNDFSIQSNEVASFTLPNAQSAVLNMVSGFNPSLIEGVLESNGKVYLMNPQGVFIGREGSISTKGFLATTLNVDIVDFLKNSRLVLNGHSAAMIQNFGVICADQGDILLIAREVENRGKILSPEGTASLIGAQEVFLCQKSSRAFVKMPTSGRVCNEGVIKAASIELKASGGNTFSVAVSTYGVLEAIGIERELGTLMLRGECGKTVVGGKLLARKSDSVGGDIHLLGENVELLNSAFIDASGNNGGGEVLVGGGLRGKNPSIINAKKVSVSAEAQIFVDAKIVGDGGKAIFWGDESNIFHGSVSAKGGKNGGDGGFIEISSPSVFGYHPKAITTDAANGKVGELLLDPTDIQITNISPSDPSFSNPYSPSTTTANIYVGDIIGPLTNSNVTIISSGSGAGNGDISILTPIVWTTTTSTTKLSLHAYRDIYVNQNIYGNGARVFITAFNGPDIEMISSNGTIHVNADVISRGGNGRNGFDGSPGTSIYDGGPGFQAGSGGEIIIHSLSGDIILNNSEVSSIGGNGGGGGNGASDDPPGDGGNGASGSQGGLVDVNASQGSIRISAQSSFSSIAGNGGNGGNSGFGDPVGRGGDGGYGGVSSQVLLSANQSIINEGSAGSFGGNGGNGGNGSYGKYKGNGGDAQSLLCTTILGKIMIDGGLKSEGGAVGAVGAGTPSPGDDADISMVTGTSIEILSGSDIVSSAVITLDFGNAGDSILNLQKELPTNSTGIIFSHGFNDTVKLGDGVTIPGVVNPGSGNNCLDYSDYTSDISVDLTTNIATGFGGISNFQNVIASKGSNTLLGKAGENNIFEFQTSQVGVSTVDGNDPVILQNQLIFNTSTDNDVSLTSLTSGQANGVIIFSAIASLKGGQGSDTLGGLDEDNQWNITQSNGGSLSTFVFENISSLVGGTQKDTFVMSDQKGMSGLIDGGSDPGPNVLDYSAYSTPVFINISEGLATNVGAIRRIQEGVFPPNQEVIEERSINTQMFTTYNIDTYSKLGNFNRYLNFSQNTLTPFEGFYYQKEHQKIHGNQ